MIRYALTCDNDHRFESWFRNSEAFDTLSSSSNVSCPHCGSTAVSKALMAPSVGKEVVQHRQPTVTPAQGPAEMQPGEAPANSQAVMAQAEQLRRMLQAMRRKVEESCDYVGGEFAEEARRIHYGESEQRGIYGETSKEEAEALADEGIDFGRIPWVPREDA